MTTQTVGQDCGGNPGCAVVTRAGGPGPVSVIVLLYSSFFLSLVLKLSKLPKLSKLSKLSVVLDC